MMKRLALSMIAALALATGLVGPSAVTVHAAPTHPFYHSCDLWDSVEEVYVNNVTTGYDGVVWSVGLFAQVDHYNHSIYCGYVDSLVHWWQYNLYTATLLESCIYSYAAQICDAPTDGWTVPNSSGYVNTGWVQEDMSCHLWLWAAKASFVSTQYPYFTTTASYCF